MIRGLIRHLRLILCLLLLASLVSSCAGRKKEDESTATILMRGFMSVDLPGGMMLYGHHQESNQVFSIQIGGANGDPVLILPKGMYNFLVVGWDGPQKMEGFTRCAAQYGYPILDNEVVVSLTLNNISCNAPEVAPAESLLVDFQPSPIEFITCSDPRAVEHGDDDAQRCVRGAAVSYHVALPEVILSPAAFPADVPSSGLLSQCVTDSDTSFGSPEASSNIKLPAFGPAAGVPLPVIIRAYTGAGCSGSFEEFYYPFGLAGGEISGYSKSRSMFTDGLAKVFMHSDHCAGAGMNNSPFAGGAVKANPDINVICTMAQLGSVAAEAGNNRTFVLMRDINGGGGNYTITNAGTPFNGKFIGMDNEISNVNIVKTGDNVGLFEVVNGGQINDLKLNYITINATDASNVGALVGDGQQTDIDNINAQNIQIIVNTTPSKDSVGGLVGRLFDGASMSAINNVTVDFSSISVTGDYSRVGGIVGYLDGTGGGTQAVAVRSSDVYSMSITDTDSTTSNAFGGIAGMASNADGELWGNHISELTIDLSGKDSVGGALGFGANARLVANRAFPSSGGASISVNACPVGGIGGLIGSCDGCNTVEFNWVDMDIDIYDHDCDRVGGFVGDAWNAGNYNFNQSEGDILECGLNNCGGFVGRFAAGNIADSFAYGDVLDAADINGGDAIGGFAGINQGSIVKAAAYGDVIAGSGSGVGGFIGVNASGANNVGDLLADGNVTGDDTVGGMIGDVQSGTAFIGGLLARGSVTGNVSVNDFAGADATALTGTADRCHVDSATGTTQASCTAIDSTVQGNFNTGFAFNTNFGSPWYDAGANGPRLGMRAMFDLIKGSNDHVSGSLKDPIELYNRDQWQLIGDKPFLMDKFIRLQADMDFSGITDAAFNPIGSNTTNFQGHFSGNGFAIKNLSVNLPAQDYLGIFGVLGSTTIGGAKIEDFNMYGGPSLPLYIENVQITGRDRVGLLAGMAQDSAGSEHESVRIFNVITDSASAVNGRDHVGGVVGEVNFNTGNFESKLEFIRNSASVTVSACDAPAPTPASGGVIGEFAHNYASDYDGTAVLLNFGPVNAGAGCDFVGGVIGSVAGAGAGDWVAVGLVNIGGDVTGSATSPQVGGVIGNATKINLSVAVNEGANVVGETQVGGIIGNIASGQVQYSYVLGDPASPNPDVNAIGGTGVSGGLIGNLGGAGITIAFNWTSDIYHAGTSSSDDFLGPGTPAGAANSNLSNSGATHSQALSDAQMRDYGAVRPHMTNIGFDQAWFMQPGDYMRSRLEFFIFHIPGVTGF